MTQCGIIGAPQVTFNESAVAIHSCPFAAVQKSLKFRSVNSLMLFSHLFCSIPACGLPMVQSHVEWS